MKIAICDDDALCRKQISSFLTAYAAQRDLELSVSVFDRASALMENVQHLDLFDIYILDIIIPGMNGIQLGIQLRQADPDGIILYLTSSPEYALDSYRARAFDYLLKPLQKEQLFSSLDQAFGIMANRKKKSLIVKTRESSIKLSLDTILYAELLNRKVTYYLINGNTVETSTIRTTFAESIQELLADSRFVLCGPGLAVNLYHITMTDSDTLYFKNGKKVYVGKRAGRDIRSAWSDFWLEGDGSK